MDMIVYIMGEDVQEVTESVRELKLILLVKMT